jgi:hypothetical protein
MINLLPIALIVALQGGAPPGAGSQGLVGGVAQLSSSATNDARFDVLTAMLRARNLTFTVEPFTLDKPAGREPRTEGRNIVVTLGEGASEIVVGAHYDAARLADGSLSKGAIDNAASCVLLINVAEALRTEKLTTRVRFVWFDMEELGLLGSAQYVQKHATDKIVAMLNFDVNGYGDTVLFGPSERPESVALRRALLQACAAENANCVGFPQMPPGDDRSFVTASIPTLSLAILPAVEAHQLWLMMNAGSNSGLAPGTAPAIMKTIHTPEDTPDKAHEQEMVGMARLALSLLRALAIPHP